MFFLNLQLTNGCEEYTGAQTHKFLQLAVVIPFYGAHPHFGLVEHASTEVNKNAQPVFQLENIAIH